MPILLEHIQLNDEDLKDTKHLAEILKYKNNSIKTIINVLEWEDSNIRYCYEKSNVYYFITFFIIVGLVWAIFPEVWLWCEQVFCISPTIHIIICCLYFIITIILFLFLCGVVGTFLHLWATFFTLSKCDSKILKLKEGLFTTLSLIWISTSLKTILKTKYAICRDYAKLTSAILHNLNIKHYFLVYPTHVAVAVKIDDYYYVIDQKLPIYKIDVWLKKLGKEKVKIYTPVDIYNSKLKFVEKYYKNENNLKSEISDDILRKIEEDVKKELQIKNAEQYNKKVEPIPVKLSIPIENYDEITHYSIVRVISKEIYNKFLTNIKNVSNIEIKKDEGKFAVNVYYEIPNSIPNSK